MSVLEAPKKRGKRPTPPPPENTPQEDYDGDDGGNNKFAMVIGDPNSETTKSTSIVVKKAMGCLNDETIKLKECDSPESFETFLEKHGIRTIKSINIVLENPEWSQECFKIIEKALPQIDEITAYRQEGKEKAAEEEGVPSMNLFREIFGIANFLRKINVIKSSSDQKVEITPSDKILDIYKNLSASEKEEFENFLNKMEGDFPMCIDIQTDLGDPELLKDINFLRDAVPAEKDQIIKKDILDEIAQKIHSYAETEIIAANTIAQYLIINGEDSLTPKDKSENPMEEFFYGRIDLFIAILNDLKSFI